MEMLLHSLLFFQLAEISFQITLEIEGLPKAISKGAPAPRLALPENGGNRVITLLCVGNERRRQSPHDSKCQGKEHNSPDPSHSTLAGILSMLRFAPLLCAENNSQEQSIDMTSLQSCPLGKREEEEEEEGKAMLLSRREASLHPFAISAWLTGKVQETFGLTSLASSLREVTFIGFVRCSLWLGSRPDLFWFWLGVFTVDCCRP